MLELQLQDTPESKMPFFNADMIADSAEMNVALD